MVLLGMIQVALCASMIVSQVRYCTWTTVNTALRREDEVGAGSVRACCMNTSAVLFTRAGVVPYGMRSNATRDDDMI